MTPSTVAERLADNLQSIQRRIARACEQAGRDPAEVTLLAVSKYRPIEHVRTLYDLGLREFAESRVQDGRDRIPDLPSGIRWHLIGRLQTNKAKYLPGLFHTVHSVDRPDVAEALNKAYAKQGEMAEVYAQINISGEDQKAGVSAADAAAFVRDVASRESLRLAGLMTMAPYVDDPEEVRPVFRQLRELRDRLQDESGLALPALSMGMTGDFEVAIEEGATIVRVGTALFDTGEADR
ncbi:MAG: YggS family pyridoxal phosphate-dependent enzyme [Sumerlaeia bacterium]